MISLGTRSESWLLSLVRMSVNCGFAGSHVIPSGGCSLIRRGYVSVVKPQADDEGILFSRLSLRNDKSCSKLDSIQPEIIVEVEENLKN